MNRRQSGFGSVEIIIVIAVVIAVGLAGYLVLYKKSSHSTNPHINAVNDLLGQAKIPQIKYWVINAQCGPTDAFLGYELVPKAEQEISDSQYKKLKSIANGKGLKVASFGGGGYSIEGDGWKISTFADAKGDNTAIAAEIFSKDKPQGYPEGSLVCG